MVSKIARDIVIVIPICITVLHGACTPRASTIGEGLWKQLDRIKAISLADNIIYQTDIPVTLSAPGTYSLGEDIVSTNTATPITITSDTITLDLQGYTLSQGPTATIGIQASGSTIKDGAIAGFTIGISGSTSLIDSITFEGCGIAISQSSALRAQNCVSYNCGSFYNLVTSTGGINSSINNCSIHNCTGNAIVADGVARFIVVDCTIAGVGGSGIIYNNVTTALIVDCTISDVMVHGIQATGQGGDIISDCKITNVLSGNGIQTALLSTLVQNCTIEHVVTGTGINSAAGGQRLGIYGCSISDVAGVGISDSTNSILVYNTLLANITGTPIVGSASITRKSQADVTANNTNFWQNVIA